VEEGRFLLNEPGGEISDDLADMKVAVERGAEIDQVPARP